MSETYNARVDLHISSFPLINETDFPELYQELVNIHGALEILAEVDTTGDTELAQVTASLELLLGKLRATINKLEADLKALINNDDAEQLIAYLIAST